MDRSASMSLGKTKLIGTHAVIHRNEGFGEQNADGVIKTAPSSIVDDADLSDTNSTAFRQL
ncbi:hypothetical protein [Lederbergia galactosidilytica]|uniref:hypothetical protein n=2 Tax=Lederbergia galactosidilytica TaxID=217031 RepID=UPI0007DB5343|nr:hypothetical protein [Lederbergia galactosidilytica]